MPGYRGLAHLFFRGIRSAEATDGEVAENGNYSSDYFVTAVVKKLFGLAVEATPDATGFKWTSNNPYLPGVKASVTRLPRSSLSDQYAAIWPPAAIDENGNLVGYATVEQVALDTGSEPPEAPDAKVNIWDLDARPDQLGDIIDLYAFGFNQTQIDAGQAKISFDWGVTLVSYNTFGLLDSTLESDVRFHATVPTSRTDTGISPVSGEESAVSVTETVKPGYGSRDKGAVFPANTSFTTSLGPVSAPPGTRYVQVRAGFRLATGVSALTPAQTGNYHDEWLYDNPNAGFVIGSYGEGDVAVTDGDPVVTPPGSDPSLTESAPPNDTDWDYASAENPVIAGSSTVGQVIDLYEVGFTQQEIDDGLVYVEGGWTVEFDSTAGQTWYRIYFHTQPPVSNAVNFRVSEISGQDGTTDPVTTLSATHYVGLNRSLQVPPNARYVQFASQLSGGSADPTISENYWRIFRLGYGAQHCAADDLIGPLPDANPARIVWEAMTNPEWGKGEPLSMMDAASFDAAAEALYNERFGLSMGFFQQDTIENFIAEVLDHIQAFLYQDPATGLWTLKLLRDDYDAASLPVLDESNCQAKNRKRRLWGETINEIIVSYTDPNTESEVTVSAHDLGNIAIQGGVVSETRDYYGIRNALLAQKVANRDVRAAGYPLFSAQITVDRRMWDARPGDVFKFSWADDGIDQIVVRVMAVDYGKPGDRKIVLDVTEDIFSIEQAQFSSPQTTGWNNVENFPTPVDAQTAITLPLPSLVRAGATVADIDAEYPTVSGAIYADDFDSRPDGIEVHSAVVRANGTTKVSRIAQVVPSYAGFLIKALPQEVSSTLPNAMLASISAKTPEAGDFYMIGLNERFTELVMLDTYNAANDRWTVQRGMWDTVPLSWPRGSLIWAFTPSTANTDPKARSAGESVTYNLLTRTSLGVLAFNQSTALTVTYTERPFAPFRPADAQLDGLGFGGVVQREAPFPTEIEATWKIRNRTTEDQVALQWDDDSAAPESGQTTVLRILRDDGTLYQEITGLTGTSRTVLVSELPPGLEGYIEFVSERDGIRSVFGARRYFDIRPPTGYGLAYGLGYSQNAP